jgi:protein SCO1
VKDSKLGAPTDLDSRFRGNDACSGCSDPIAQSSFRPSAARAGIQRPRGGSFIVILAMRNARRNPGVHWGPLSLAALVLTLGIFSNAAFSQSQLPEAVRNVGIDQRLNEQLPLDIEFRNEDGRLVTLGQFFHDKPVVLSLVYHECPMLCNEVLEGMLRAFRVLRFDVGKEFDVLTVSFNPREDAPLAKSAKESYVRRYKREGAAEGWHFLTGDQTSIDRLTKAVGFRYRYDAQKNQYAHAGGIMVLTPQGRLSRYFYGIEFAPKDLRLGLIEASQNKIGSIVDQVLLFCYHYDPVTGKYGLVILRTMRIVGVLFVLGLGMYVILMLRRERVVPTG